MQLPAIQYGDWKTVKKRMSRVVTRLKRGEDLIELMTAGGMLDTDTTPGMLMMSGITPGTTPHFHCFTPWKATWDALATDAEPGASSQVEDAIFEASLRISWGVLGLLSTENQFWLILASRHRPLLHATLEVWAELDGVGERYYSAVHGQWLWSVPNNLHYVLANLAGLSQNEDVSRRELGQFPYMMENWRMPLTEVAASSEATPDSPLAQPIVAETCWRGSRRDDLRLSMLHHV